jgi:serine protease Do
MLDTSKKLSICIFLICLPAALLFSAPLRNYVCIVRGNLSEDTVKFLKDYSDTLDSRGYSTYSKEINDYLEGSFGSGFVYYGPDGKPYVVTNRHVIAESETATVQFENEDDSTSEYKELKIIAADDDIDIALIALPSSYSRKGLELSAETVTDGEDVWSAGFPGLGSDPVWQLGKGIVTNSHAKIKDLLSPDISTIIQHSAQVDPGNSGGPLMVADQKAQAGFRVIGLNTWKAAYRESTNFSIPAPVIQSFVSKTVTGNKSADDINNRIKQFVKAAGDKNAAFFALGKYVSNSIVSKSGGDAFLSVVAKAPVSVRSTVIDIFEYDPIEGLRYAIAYDIWKEFQDENGTLTIEAGTPEDSTNGKKISLTPQGKTGINTLWNIEQGNWKIFEFDTIQNSKLGKKDKTAANNNSGFSVGEPYFISLSGGLLLPYETGTPGFSSSLLFNSSFVAFGIYFQSEKAIISTKTDSSTEYSDNPTTMTSAGFITRFQVPLSFGKFEINPYAASRLGFSNITSFLTDGSSRIHFTIGGGLEISYNISSILSPVIGAEYMHEFYNLTEKNDSIAITAGLKFFKINN